MDHQRLKSALARTQFTKPFRPTLEDCVIWTEVLNYVLFGENLITYRAITIRRMREMYALCHGRTDDNGTKYCDLEIVPRFADFSLFYSILLHELIHAVEYLELGEMSHGKFFCSYKEVAALIGIPLQRTYPRKKK